jgi:hypothetical protein
MLPDPIWDRKGGGCVNARQYDWLRENRSSAGARGLDEISARAARRRAQGERWICSPLAGVLKQAARMLRARQAAEAAWERIVRPQWRTAARVESAVAGVVVVGVDHAALLYELGRQKAALERQMRQLVPGCRRLQLGLASAGAGPADEAERGR